jgi:hypothetical protein
LDVRHRPHTCLRSNTSRAKSDVPIAPQDFRPFRGDTYSPHDVAVGPSYRKRHRRTEGNTKSFLRMVTVRPTLAYTTKRVTGAQRRNMNSDATKGGGVGQAAEGETHEIAYVDLPKICAQPKGKPLSATMFKRSQLTQIRSLLFHIGSDGRVFSMRVERTYFQAQPHKNRFSVNYFHFPIFLTRNVRRVFSMRVERTYSGVHTPTFKFYLNNLCVRIIPVKLCRSDKQHP